MTERIKKISKDSVVHVSIGALMALLVALVTGVWNLKGVIGDWERRLEGIESRIGSRWSYYMEKESWNEFARENPNLKVPNVKSIREDYSGVFH